VTLDYTVRPLSDRTWLRRTGSRETSRFTASWSDTLGLLEREVGMLRGKQLVIGIDVEERMLRLDGKLRADARSATPAVEVAFESKHGPLYRSDRFVRQSWSSKSMESWQHNVRAIAMTLEALRAVDRYAATQSGEQYRGYRALPAGRGDAATAMTATGAAEVLLRLAVGPDDDAMESAVAALRRSPEQLRDTIREARWSAHPDRNDGDRGQWNLVDNAVQTLQQAGWLPKAVAS
jgi:hypothetical protein